MWFVPLGASVDVQWIVWPVLAAIFGLGVLATFAPDRFANIALRGSRWVDTEEVLKLLDRPIDVDRYVLRYSRVFGVAVVLAAVWLAYVYWNYAASR